MRIGIDISKALAPRDGIGNYTYHLTRALARLDRDHDFRLVSLSRRTTAAEVRREFRSLPSNWSLCRAGSDPDVDVFHAPSWDYPVHMGDRTLVTCHDLTFLSHPQFHEPVNKTRCLRGMLRAIVDGARFLCVSEHTRSELHERLQVPESRTHVIYEGASEVFRRADESRSRRLVARHLGITGDFLLTVGRLEPRKNLLRLVEAYDSLPDGLRERYSLVLAGPGGWRNEALDDYLATRTTSGAVHRPGFVSEQDQVALYSAARAFVYPSLAEGFGLPVLEALACGAAVATSSVSSLPEVAGDAAVYFQPEDVGDLRSTLLRLVGDDDLVAQLRGRAPDRAALFSWDRAAEQTLEAYAAVGGRAAA